MAQDFQRNQKCVIYRVIYHVIYHQLTYFEILWTWMSSWCSAYLPSFSGLQKPRENGGKNNDLTHPNCDVAGNHPKFGRCWNVFWQSLEDFLGPHFSSKSQILVVPGESTLSLCQVFGRSGCGVWSRNAHVSRRHRTAIWVLVMWVRLKMFFLSNQKTKFSY